MAPKRQAPCGQHVSETLDSLVAMSASRDRTLSSNFSLLVSTEVAVVTLEICRLTNIGVVIVVIAYSRGVRQTILFLDL